MPLPDTTRFDLLLGLIGRINSTTELDALLAAIMDAAKVIMQAQASSLMMLDPQTGELIVSLPTGPARAQISGMRIPPGKGFGGWVAAHGEPLVVADAASDPRFYGDLAKDGFRTGSLICVPLANSQGTVIGVLQALNPTGRPEFDASDIPLFAALAHQAAIAIEKTRLYEASLEKERMQHQLDLARDIQVGFWPKEIPRFRKGTVAGSSRPAAEVGGDYYDLVALDEDRCVLLVADISGKGLPAALLMASLHGAVRALLETRCPLTALVNSLNRVLVRDTPIERFVTLFCAVIDLEKRQLTYVNAGHNPPFILSPSNGAVVSLADGGPVLGFLERLEYSSFSVELQSGDLLVMFSDGITEAQDPAEEMYGEDRLVEVVSRNAGLQDAAELLARIEQDVSAFCSGAPQYDDATLVVAQVC